jgi:four helix bundle protein
MQTHKDLQVWKLSIELVNEVYLFSKKLPREEQFGLVSQMRRAAVSVASNLAEGAARKSTKEFIRFSNISIGSCSELETLMIITCNIYQEDTSTLQSKISVIIKLLVSLTASLRQKLAQSTFDQRQ